MNLAIITGTTRGLGAVLADAFDAGGWVVSPISRPHFDLANLDGAVVEELFKRTASQQWSRALLIHNAAEMHVGRAADAAPHARRITQINLASVIELTALFLKHFPNGEVAAVTSGAARVGVSHWSIYCATKAGLEGYFRALKAEGISTHLFEPGVVDTGMQQMLREADWPDAERFAEYHRKQRLKKPQEVAERIFRGLTADHKP